MEVAVNFTAKEVSKPHGFSYMFSLGNCKIIPRTRCRASVRTLLHSIHSGPLK